MDSFAPKRRRKRRSRDSRNACTLCCPNSFHCPVPTPTTPPPGSTLSSPRSTSNHHSPSTMTPLYTFTGLRHLRHSTIKSSLTYSWHSPKRSAITEQTGSECVPLPIVNTSSTTPRATGREGSAPTPAARAGHIPPTIARGKESPDAAVQSVTIRPPSPFVSAHSAGAPVCAYKNHGEGGSSERLQPCCGQSRRSMMVALAIPPPSHITCMP